MFRSFNNKIDNEKVDFHSHSTMSDGGLTPVEVVQLAASRNITALSLTDHDTVEGVEEARLEAEKHGIKFISGVEISALVDKGTLHILGYNIDIDSPVLQERLNEYRIARNSRNSRIIARLQELGIDITMDEVRAKTGLEETMGRPHIAAVLIEKGIVQNSFSAFNQYLGNGGAAYFEKELFTAQEAIEIIHAAGGKAFIAHAASLYLNNAELKEYLIKLKEFGLDGMEVYTTAHTSKKTKEYWKIANSLGLLISGGSDFHGAFKPQVKLGCCRDNRGIRRGWVSDWFFRN